MLYTGAAFLWQWQRCFSCMSYCCELKSMKALGFLSCLNWNRMVCTFRLLNMHGTNAWRAHKTNPNKAWQFNTSTNKCASKQSTENKQRQIQSDLFIWHGGTESDHWPPWAHRLSEENKKELANEWSAFDDRTRRFPEASQQWSEFGFVCVYYL